MMGFINNKTVLIDEIAIAAKIIHAFSNFSHRCFYPYPTVRTVSEPHRFNAISSNFFECA